MPHLLIALSIALQLFCLVHVFRTGRPYWWAWIILIGSFLGSAVYLVTQVLPEFGRSRSARRALRRVQLAVDPDRERRVLAEELERSDTVDNRLRLARERLQAGDVLSAEPLFESCLKGLHANDPDILLALAESRFRRGDPAACRDTLDRLIAANPDFRSPQGHLLYARALQQLGELQAAAEEYAVLVDGYAGEEARVRYGLLLKQLDRHSDAQALFREAVKRARLAPRYYRDDNREWLQLAEAELARVDGTAVRS
jgi:hypothetical protein